MEFKGDLDLEVYNYICEPVIVVDEKDKIKWANTSALKLCKVSGIEIIEDLRLDRIISFYNFEDKLFQPRKIEKINSITKVKAIAMVNEVKREYFLVVKGIFLNDKKYTFLLLNPKIENDNNEDNANSLVLKEKSNLNFLGEHETHITNAIFGATPTGIVIEKNKKIVYINSSSKKIFGYKNYLGSSFYESIGVNFVEESIYFDEEAKNEGNINIIERKFINDEEKEIFCEICPISFIKKDILYNVYLIRDITDKVRAQKALKRNHDNYVTLLKALPFGVAIYKDNKILLANEIHKTNFGYKNREELNKKRIWEAVHPNYSDIVRNMYYNSYSNNCFYDFKEIKAINSEGKCIDIEIAITVMNVDNNKSMVVMSREITEKKKAEINKLKLEQAIKYDKLKTEFISNMSHELKTPLNIILSTIQVMEYTYRNSEDLHLKKYLDLTKVNGYRLLRLINNLIDVTRIDVGNLKMNFANYDIVKIVEDITMAAVEYVESRDMTLVFDTDIEEKIIGIDKVNIERIMLNLLSNAVKFSKEKGNIKVELHDLGEWVQIKVMDNGIGIPEEKIDSIFDKFVQSEELFTRSHEGSGVGLALVRSIVENHGGVVYANSIINRGSEFIVELPNIKSKNQRNEEDYSNFKENQERVKIEFSDIYK